MAVEEPRGCGYRKVGGIYLRCDSGGHECDRMPIPLTVCPCCGQGVKPARGWTWVEPVKLLNGDHHVPGEHGLQLCPEDNCPVCRPVLFEGNKAGLLWIGDRHYTPDTFIQESVDMGISRRVANIPHGFELGTTWVFLAHKKAGSALTVDDDGNPKQMAVPGIFTAFKPTRVEMLVTDETDPELVEKLRTKGITPVVVPAGDPDHAPRTRADKKMTDRIPRVKGGE